MPPAADRPGRPVSAATGNRCGSGPDTGDGARARPQVHGPSWWTGRRFPIRWEGRYGFDVLATDRHKVTRAGSRHRARWAQMATDALTRHYLHFPRYIALYDQRRTDSVPELHLAVEALDTGRLVAGVCAFPGPTDHHPGLELHWAVHPRHRGTGILSDVLPGVIDWLHAQSGPGTHIQAQTCAANAPSAHLARKLLGDLGPSGAQRCQFHADDADAECGGHGRFWCSCARIPEG